MKKLTKSALHQRIHRHLMADMSMAITSGDIMLAHAAVGAGRDLASIR